jgi:hypothetical protein
VNAAIAEIGGETETLRPMPPFPGVYFDDPWQQLPATSLDAWPRALVTTSERIAVHLAETLTPSLARNREPAHIAVGDPFDDVNKQTLLSFLGVDVPTDHRTRAMDPVGWASALQVGRKPSVSVHSDASASGVVALGNALQRIGGGRTAAALVLSATGKTVPVPFETAPLGSGAERSALPFVTGAEGHFYSEGGVGFALAEEHAAEAAGTPALVRIAGMSTGAFGSPVVNRIVVADVVDRALASAGVPSDAPVFVDLYGRGNAVDDAAELSAIELLANRRPNLVSGYLSGDSHYVIGSHGLLGLERLVAARRDGSDVSALAHHPSAVDRPARPVPHLVADPADHDTFVFLNYSMHGTCVALVVTLPEADRG